VTSCTSTSNSTRRATCETWDLPCNWAPFLESYQTTEKTISWNRKGQNKYIHTRDVHHKRRKTRKPPQFCSTQLGSLLSLHDTVKHVKILLEKDCRRNQKKLFIPSFTLFISSPGVSYFTPRPAKRYICSTLHHVKGHFAARNPQQQQQENRKCKTTAWQERKEGRRENAALRRTRQGKLTYMAGTEKEGREKTEPSKPGRQVQDSSKKTPDLVPVHLCYKQIHPLVSLVICPLASRERKDLCMDQTFFRSTTSLLCSLFSCSVVVFTCCTPLIAKRLTFPWFFVFRLPFRLSICVPPMPLVGEAVSV
jgi:hypothetical protein